MHAQELKCPGCFAPIAPSEGGVSTCRYCGAKVAIQGGAPTAPLVESVNAAIFLEDAGDNKIEVIRVVREHTRLGLKDAKDLVERAPCVVADWPSEPLKMLDFHQDLVRAGARLRPR